MELFGVGAHDLLSGFVGALAGGLITGAAAVWAMRRQIREMRQDMQAQTYLSILKRAEDIRLSATMDFIRSIGASHSVNEVSSYDRLRGELTGVEQERCQWFSERISPDQRDAIRKLVDFFNDLAHLMRSKYIDDQSISHLYYPSIYACAVKLSPWWVKYIRVTQGQQNLYLNFEALCRYVLDLKGPEEGWPGFREWLKTHRVTASWVAPVGLSPSS